MKSFLLSVILLFSQLQNLNASRNYYSSPILSNPECNEEQLIHKGNVVKHETQIQEKDVSIVNRRGGGGGGGRGGGGGGGSRGGSGGGGSKSSGRSSKDGGGSSGRGGGLVAGAVAGSHHNHSVSSCSVHQYFQLLTTIVVMFNFIVAN